MNSGAVIFAYDVDRVARFYETLLTMSPVHVEPGLRVIASDRTELVIHALPPGTPGAPTPGTSPEPREDTYIKPFFVVPSLAAAREIAPLLGGYVLPAEREFVSRRFRGCNACDPEGNVVQFRELLLPPS
jgi:predicted enzyme related to lactoylglutathione lyase